MGKRGVSFLIIMFILMIIAFGAITSTLFILKTTGSSSVIIWLLAAILGITIFIANKNDNFGKKFLKFLWPLLIIVGVGGLIYLTDGLFIIIKDQLAWPYIYYGYSYAFYLVICGIAIKAILVMRSNRDKFSL